MSRVKWNIVANAVGRIWSVGLSVLLVPVYISFLGVEAYGLVGFAATLQTFFALLDLGLGTTINREIARLSAMHDSMAAQRDLVRSLEVVYWGIALFIGTIVVLSAPFFARNWIHPQNLTIDEVTSALRLIGVMILFQFPYALYQGGITGLQRQVPLNVILVLTGTFRSVGAVVVLALISPIIQVYFFWQVLSSLVLTGALAWYLWRQLQSSAGGGRFSRTTLRRISRFALGMSSISVTAILLYAADRIVLSNRLSLEQFGYYSLAWTVAAIITVVVAPVNMAVFPRFSQLAAESNAEALSRLYHLSCQLVSVGVMPIIAVTIFFSSEILMAWTGDFAIVQGASLFLTLLIIGNGMNSLVNMPYTLQLAFGWTKLAFYANLIGLVTLVPLLVVLAGPLGGIAGALFWIVVNTGYMFVNVIIMHRRILPGEAARWYLQDLGLPFAGALLAAVPVRLLYHGGSRVVDLAVVLLAGMVALAAAALMAPLLRRYFFSWLSLRMRRTQATV